MRYFNFGVGVNFYGGFINTLIVIIPYLLCIVALSIFVASIANTPGKFNAYISVIAVPIAMLGGGFWPLEIVTSEIMQAISYISPIRYGMELLFGVTLYGESMSDIVEPISILLFMTVLLMGLRYKFLREKRTKINFLKSVLLLSSFCLLEMLKKETKLK